MQVLDDFLQLEGLFLEGLELDPRAIERGLGVAEFLGGLLELLLCLGHVILQPFVPFGQRLHLPEQHLDLFLLLD